MKFDCGCYVNEKEIFQCLKHKKDMIESSFVDIPDKKLAVGEGPVIVESFRKDDNIWISGFPKGPDRSIRLAHDKDCHCERCEPHNE